MFYQIENIETASQVGGLLVQGYGKCKGYELAGSTHARVRASSSSGGKGVGLHSLVL